MPIKTILKEVEERLDKLELFKVTTDRYRIQDKFKSFLLQSIEQAIRQSFEETMINEVEHEEWCDKVNDQIDGGCDCNKFVIDLIRADQQAKQDKFLSE